jgi:mannitol/fructose-specific phosphotransferase system IIA component (Ntr-type)
MKALDIQNKKKMIIRILQKGGYENDPAGSDRKLIVKLLPPPSTESPHKHLTICASIAGLAG